MKQTGHHSDIIESYAEAKNKSFVNNINSLEAQLNNIASSSLKVEDKKLLLIKMKQAIETDILTKFSY